MTFMVSVKKSSQLLPVMEKSRLANKMENNILNLKQEFGINSSQESSKNFVNIKEESSKNFVSFKEESSKNFVYIKEEILDIAEVNISPPKNEFGTNFLIINNTVIYKCEVCGIELRHSQDYKDHQKMHNIKSKTCPICNIVCQNLSKLKEHISIHLGKKEYKCEICDKRFLLKYYVKSHMKRVHSEEKQFKCDKCDEAFRDLGGLRNHNLIHMKNIEDFVCKSCGQDCKHPLAFQRHMQNHHTAEHGPLNCGVCNKKFDTDRVLQMHLKTHSELTYPCEYCMKIFPTMYKLNKHLGRAHVPSCCEKCNTFFYNRAEFTKHMKGHEQENANLSCLHCNRMFNKPKNLSEHIRLQHTSNGKLNQCRICEKKFINESLLKNHIKTHRKCIKCDVCGSSFSSVYNLKTHMVVHTKERNFICDTCQKSFTSKQTLTIHVGTHRKIRAFSCDKCGKSFKTNTRLYAHKLNHRSELKFQCDLCPSKFNLKQRLKLHMVRHSKLKPFICYVCEKKFKHKRTLLKHSIRTGHKLEKVKQLEDNFMIKEEILDDDHQRGIF